MAHLTFEQAAAIPCAGCTALQGLRDKGEVKAGQRVLIYGAGGGVGTFAIQIAKSLGAPVTAVTSTKNVDLLHSKRERRYDVMFDIAANRVKHADLVVLKELVETGKLSPVIDRQYPLARSLTPFDTSEHATLEARSSSASHEPVPDEGPSNDALNLTRPCSTWGLAGQQG